jgi:hypothetical protein
LDISKHPGIVSDVRQPAAGHCVSIFGHYGPGRHCESAAKLTWP